MNKMSKSSQSEKSIEEISSDTVERARLSQEAYEATRLELQKKYGTKCQA